MQLSTVNAWLNFIEKVHPAEIEFGLERVRIVAEKLDLLNPTCPVITIGGTNGKGSTVAGLEQIYLAAGFRVGAFTSPFLFRYNEEIRINGVEVADAILMQAFQQIEDARGETPLTFFEFGTLAALLIFKESALNVWLLEVGLGGRLDAVNVIDADLSIITSIDLDHTAWLGSTRDAIAYEKAGIFRPARPVICGDTDPPAKLIESAEALACPFYCKATSFRYLAYDNHWEWFTQDVCYQHLPMNQLLLCNMATVLMAVTVLQQKLKVREDAIKVGLSKARVQGRLEWVEGDPAQLFDVSHNPAAVLRLRDCLKECKRVGKTFAVFSMLADKDIASSLQIIKHEIDVWYVAPLKDKRSMSSAALQCAFESAGIQSVHYFDSIQSAYISAMREARSDDLVINFGSFHTVSEAKRVSANILQG